MSEERTRQALEAYENDKRRIDRLYGDLYESAETASQVLEANRWHESAKAKALRDFITACER